MAAPPAATCCWSTAADVGASTFGWLTGSVQSKALPMKDQRGFTLLEMLAALTLMAICSTVLAGRLRPERALVVAGSP